MKTLATKAFQTTKNPGRAQSPSQESHHPQQTPPYVKKRNKPTCLYRGMLDSYQVGRKTLTEIGINLQGQALRLSKHPSHIKSALENSDP